MSARAKAPAHVLLRRLPSVERLLEKEAFRRLADEFGRRELVRATRSTLAEIRKDVVDNRTDSDDLRSALDSIEDRVRSRLVPAATPSLVPVINATGIILHTNLGRAPLSPPAIEALRRIGRGYSNLELDLLDGKRGRREQHAARLLARLFAGHDAYVVNNNAAAVLLVLNSFAESREVLISRGELVEIGGSFRIPDILEKSGARLREVGTTNKTRVADYENALSASTGLILRVHHSNFRIIGFTERPAAEELVALGKAHGLPVVEDFGSGNLISLAPYGLPEEPRVQDSLEKGVHLVTFSGDKLLGGPQAGLILGSAEGVERCRRNPLARALRVDKLTYAALEATLAAYVRDKPLEEIPVLRMTSASAEEIASRSQRLLSRLEGVEGLALHLVEGFSKVGGGAAPEVEIPTHLITVRHRGLSAQQVLDGLRAHRPPIIARIAEDRVRIDLRTVLPEQEELLEAALKQLQRHAPDESEPGLRGDT